jgi:hypothetical protein
LDFGKNQALQPASAGSIAYDFNASSYPEAKWGREMSLSDTSQRDALSLA